MSTPIEKMEAELMAILLENGHELKDHNGNKIGDVKEISHIALVEENSAELLAELIKKELS